MQRRASGRDRDCATQTESLRFSVFVLIVSGLGLIVLYYLSNLIFGETKTLSATLREDLSF